MKTNVDRELLELAAKAAGYSGVITEYSNGYCEMGLTNHFKPNGSNIWNPLANDDDALRLAVVLRLVIDINDEDGTVFVRKPWNADCEVQESLFGDPFAATRRAIVRAAAEIGKASHEKASS